MSQEWNRLSTLRTWLNEPSEVHALWFGMCFIIGVRVSDLPEKNQGEVEAEYQYYLLGKVVSLVLAALCISSHAGYV